MPEWAISGFLEKGFKIEAKIPRLYNGKTDGFFLGCFFDAHRSFITRNDLLDIEELKSFDENVPVEVDDQTDELAFRQLGTSDIAEMIELYNKTYQVYSVPIFESGYLSARFDEGDRFYGVSQDDKLVGICALKHDPQHGHTWLTDYGFEPKGPLEKVQFLLIREAGRRASTESVNTIYTYVRAKNKLINAVLGGLGFSLSGTLVNNTLIGDSIEHMVVWYKEL